jgi:hypothetical protein
MSTQNYGNMTNRTEDQADQPASGWSSHTTEYAAQVVEMAADLNQVAIVTMKNALKFHYFSGCLRGENTHLGEL